MAVTVKFYIQEGTSLMAGITNKMHDRAYVRARICGLPQTDDKELYTGLDTYVLAQWDTQYGDGTGAPYYHNVFTDLMLQDVRCIYAGKGIAEYQLRFYRTRGDNPLVDPFAHPAREGFSGYAKHKEVTKVIYQTSTGSVVEVDNPTIPYSQTVYDYADFTYGFTNGFYSVLWDYVDVIKYKLRIKAGKVSDSSKCSAKSLIGHINSKSVTIGGCSYGIGELRYDGYDKSMTVNSSGNVENNLYHLFEGMNRPFGYQNWYTKYLGTDGNNHDYYDLKIDVNSNFSKSDFNGAFPYIDKTDTLKMGP